MIQELDETILSIFQRLSDWLHTWTGLDSLDQTRAFAGLAALSWLLSIVYDLIRHHWFNWFGAFCLISMLYRCLFESETNRAIRSQSQRGLRNPRRIDPLYQFTRLSMLLITLLSFPLEILVPNPVSLVIVIYALVSWLDCCDPQTPRTGRIRQAIQRLSIIRMPQPSSGEA